MIIKNDVTYTNVESKQFTLTSNSKIFKILSESLYKNSIASIVRELVANAIDVHKINNSNKKIEIGIISSNIIDSNKFYIRDYGTGLSKEDIYSTYTCFGYSTKTTSNNYIGAFGIGSKSPFSYSSSFIVKSYFNHVLYTYLMFIKNEEPNVSLISEESTEEDDGLEININIKDNDVFEFKKQIVNTSVINYKLINSNIDVKFEILQDEDSYLLLKFDDINKFHEYFGNYRYTNCVFIYNNSIYKYERYNSISYNIFHAISDNYLFLAKIPNCSLTLSSSREDIIVNDSNNSIIDNYIIASMDYVYRYICTNYFDNPLNSDKIYEYRSLCRFCNCRYDLRTIVHNEFIVKDEWSIYHHYKYNKSINKVEGTISISIYRYYKFYVINNDATLNDIRNYIKNNPNIGSCLFIMDNKDINEIISLLYNVDYTRITIPKYKSTYVSNKHKKNEIEYKYYNNVMIKKILSPYYSVSTSNADSYATMDINIFMNLYNKDSNALIIPTFMNKPRLPKDLSNVICSLDNLYSFGEYSMYFINTSDYNKYLPLFENKQKEILYKFFTEKTCYKDLKDSKVCLYNLYSEDQNQNSNFYKGELNDKLQNINYLINSNKKTSLLSKFSEFDFFINNRILIYCSNDFKNIFDYLSIDYDYDKDNKILIDNINKIYDIINKYPFLKLFNFNTNKFNILNECIEKFIK